MAVKNPSLASVHHHWYNALIVHFKNHKYTKWLLITICNKTKDLVTNRWIHRSCFKGLIWQIHFISVPPALFSFTFLAPFPQFLRRNQAVRKGSMETKWWVCGAQFKNWEAPLVFFSSHHIILQWVKLQADLQSCLCNGLWHWRILPPLLSHFLTQTSVKLHTVTRYYKSV